MTFFSPGDRQNSPDWSIKPMTKKILEANLDEEETEESLEQIQAIAEA